MVGGKEQTRKSDTGRVKHLLSLVAATSQYVFPAVVDTEIPAISVLLHTFACNAMLWGCLAFEAHKYIFETKLVESVQRFPFEQFLNRRP